VTRKDLDHYKQVLLTRKTELMAGKVATEAPLPASRAELGDIVDQATAATEAEVQVRLRQTDSRLLRAIEEALARIERSNFGVCADCGNAISAARLEAVPWTRHCRECKERSQG